MVSAEEFYNPPVKYRIKPFWFWNGEMTKDEIRRQIEEMADKGLGGMYICARQGMTVPYMSEEWLGLVEYACEEAKRCGLEAWLYDEYPYPSGMSGGEVLLEHPEAEHKILRHKTFCVLGGETVYENLGWGRILFARAFKKKEDGSTNWQDFIDINGSIGILQTEKIYQQTGLTKYNSKRFFSYGPKKVLTAVLPEGSWRLEIYSEETLGDFKYYGGFFDPCNKEAVKTFLKTTHARYDKAVGHSFGKSIFGMFSDEVGLLSPIPWSPKLPEAFLKRNGYSILECLPALHDDTVKNAFRIRYDFYETAHELFRESYHKQVSDWCKEHSLLYATEVPSMRHSTQRYSDVIGGDTAHEKLGKPLEWIYDEYIRNYRSNAKAVSSLARQLNKPYAMIESFHSVGWTMTLQDAKWMIDRLGSSGINLYNFHAFYYTIQDITKHDAPPSQFLQNPYWKHYRKLADYVGRMGVLVSNTRADIQIAVLDPAAALWTRLGNPFQGFVYRGESEEEKAECGRLRDSWVSVCKQLLFHQLDYDHLDAEILAESSISKGIISLGKAAYSVVVLPPCHCMEALARKKLEEFVRQGGCLISTGTIPYISIDREESDAKTRESWKDLFSNENTYQISDCEEELAKICCLHTSQAASVVIKEGNPRDVIAVTRLGEAEDGAYVFVANQGKNPVTAKITAAGFAKAEAQYLDLEYGTVRPETNQEGDTVTVYLNGFESRWIRWIKSEAVPKEAGLSNGCQSSAVLTVPLEAGWKCRPMGKNICRFATAKLSFDREAWRSVEVKTLIEQWEDAGLLDSKTMRMEGMFGTPKKIRPAYPLTCYYRILFQSDLLFKDLELFMDRETISGSWKLLVNGWEVDEKEFQSIRVNDQNNCFVNIAPFVKKGENEILISCEAQKDEDGLRDPLYLRGEFGVFSSLDGNSARLTSQPDKICPDRDWPLGFPYYSGTMEYQKMFTAEELSGMISVVGNQKSLEEKVKALSQDFPETFEVRLGEKHARYDCQEVLVNGRSLGVKAYAPYKWECKRCFLKEEENQVTLRITNTLANMLDGTYFDYEAHQLMPIKP